MTNTMKSLLALCLFCGAGAVSTAETPVRHTSFKPGEISPELALKIAKTFAAEYLDGYEAVIATHVDRGHIHSHIVFNSAIPPGTCTTGRTRESP